MRKCKKHPRYLGKRKPRARCTDCQDIFRRVSGVGSATGAQIARAEYIESSGKYR